jgi:hypothetical protein
LDVVAEEKKNKAFRREVRIWIQLLGMVMVIALSLYVFFSQPTIPSQEVMYSLIKNSFNSTIDSDFIFVRQATSNTIPSTIILNETIKGEDVVSFPRDNKTYLYYFGVDACPACASETYVLWSYLKGEFPASHVFASVAQYGIPALPVFNLTSQQMKIRMLEVPLQQLASQSIRSKLVYDWMINNTNIEQKYLFSMSGYFPAVFVVKTIGEKTFVCNAYLGIGIQEYNSNNTKNLTAYSNDVAKLGLEKSDLSLPVPKSMNANLNQLNVCIKATNEWSG